MNLLKKRYVTLIEIMIVMFLIALIIGVVAYNYRGALDEGKAFKTKTAQEKIETILTLMISENPELQEGFEQNWQKIIESSPLVQNPATLIKDGWGETFDVKMDDEGNITVTSKRYEEYQKQKKTS